MKKVLYFLAALAVSSLALSCTEEEGGVTYAYENDAILLQMDDPLTAGFTSLELYRNGEFGMERVGTVPKASIATYYEEGKFTKTSEGYKLEGFGTVGIQKQDGGTLNITVKPTGASETIVTTGSSAKPVSGLKKFDGKWKVKSTKINVTGTTISDKLAVKFDGFNANKIASWLEKNDVDIEEDIPSDAEITSIKISKFGRFNIYFKNSKLNYEGQISGISSTGEIDYDFSKYPDITVLDGSYTIKSSGTDKATLTVVTDAKDKSQNGYHVVVTITLNRVK